MRLPQWKSFSQFITYHSEQSLFVCVSLQELFLLAWKLECLSSETDNCMNIVSSYMMSSSMGGPSSYPSKTAVVAFKTMMQDGEMGGSCTRPSIASRLWSTERECECYLCNTLVSFVLNMTYSFSYTFTPPSVTTTVARSSNEESDEKGYHTNGSELIFSRSVASLFILASGESMCCLVVVVYDRFVWIAALQLCSLMLRALIWSNELSAFQTFRFRASYQHKCRITFSLSSRWRYVWCYACPQRVSPMNNMKTPFECCECT